MEAANRTKYCELIEDMMNSRASNSSDRLVSMGTVWLHGIVSTFGILENLLILWVIGFRVQRSVISVWILNLAASDLLATASLPAFTVFLAKGGTWTLGTTFCKIHSSVFFLNMFVSGFLLAAISLDRALVSLCPVWAQNHRDVGLATRVCGVIWALAFLNTVPYYLFRDTIQRRDGRIMCYYNFRQLPVPGADEEEICRSRQDVTAVSKFLLAFLLPLLVIVGSYVAVSISISRRGRRHSFRFFRLVVAVIVSFVLCWAPYHVLSLLEAVAQYHRPLRQGVARALPPFVSLAFINSLLNPLLYVFSCPDFLAKIRQSLGAVLESVLAEDLGELARRRSTARSTTSTNELLQRLRIAPALKNNTPGHEEEAEHPAVF
ncbi:prostaglandin D2 receptor 2-like [Megalops cyprinoides]|uniref:prostaglandin D2 receptor 2-like n=1 Tax=Megalops cyprinoides TaxID=118141 RepID=UPI001863F62E|nr:prostaglandin D2 receptor 2-like [Megalops cyprinoides]